MNVQELCFVTDDDEKESSELGMCVLSLIEGTSLLSLCCSCYLTLAFRPGYVFCYKIN